MYLLFYLKYYLRTRSNQPIAKICNGEATLGEGIRITEANIALGFKA